MGRCTQCGLARAAHGDTAIDHAFASPALEALRRAVARGAPIDWGAIAPPRPQDAPGWRGRIPCPCGCGTSWDGAADKAEAFAWSHPDQSRSHPSARGLGRGEGAP